MSDVQARIAELEAQVASLKAEVAADELATSRRGLLKKVALGAAAAGAGAVALGRPAAASLGTFASAATVSDVTYTGADLTTTSAVTVRDGANTALPLFPAAVGGYGSGVKVKHGVHGSTTLPAGYGVVAANAGAPADGSTVPAALAVATLGAHARLIGPQATATAAGVTNPPKTVGPTAGDFVGGELYMDDDYNLWFFVKDGTDVYPVKLAGPASAGSYHPFLPRPIRVLDTRTATGAARVPSGANPDVTLETALTGLAALASAVAVNFTVTDTVGAGFHTAYATGTPPADIRNADGSVAFSNINWDGAGQNRANLAIVPVGTKGTGNDAKPAITLLAGGGGSTHLVIDVVGYYL
jgi:hypothetical protein